jgi:hypothetical protein
MKTIGIIIVSIVVLIIMLRIILYFIYLYKESKLTKAFRAERDKKREEIEKLAIKLRLHTKGDLEMERRFLYDEAEEAGNKRLCNFLEIIEDV